MGLRLVTLGALRCYRDGAESDAFTAQRQRCALLVYLAVEQETTRDAVMAVLWPERDTDRARHALSQALYDLRRTLGDDWLAIQGERLRITPALDVDVHRFVEAVERGEPGEAVALYRGAFLAGQHLVDTQPFEAWGDRQRSRLGALHRRARRSMLSRLLEAGDLAAALECAREWSQIEPLEDEAQHRLIELLARLGHRSEALAQYEAYARLLQADELEPLDETKALVASIREGGVGAAATALEASPNVAAASAPPVPAPAPDVALPEPPSPSKRSRRWVAPLAVAAMSGAALALALAVNAGRDRAPPAELADGQTLLVLPFTHVGGVAPLVDGELCARLLAEGLSRWEGIRLVDPIRVNDALRRRGLETGSDLPFDVAVELARELGADRLLLGEVWQFGDTARALAGLYSTGRGRPLRLHQVRFAPTPTGVSAFNDLADSLLLGGSRVPTGATGARITASLPALLAYDLGEKALADWDLARAGGHFRAAAMQDSGFAHAYLRAAQVASWAADTASDAWRLAAARAAQLAERLPVPDRPLARAIHALAQRRYAQACDEYRQALARDSLSFAAWYGLAECHAADPVVEPDPTSPSGWRFRSSHHTAIEAYRRALGLAPSFNFAFRDLAFARLSYWLYAEGSRIRRGHPADSPATGFSAFPALAADTLAFVPYRLDASGGPSAPPTHARAVQRNREVLREVALGWVRSFPSSAAAHDALALALETVGLIDAGPSVERSALDAIRQARRLADGAAERVRFGTSAVRLLVKADRFAAARALADSLLRDFPDPPSATLAAGLSSLAALTGHPHQAARLLAASAGERPMYSATGVAVVPPLPVGRAGLRFAAYAAFGIPVDSLVALKERVDGLIRTWAPDQREDLRSALMDHPLSLAYPVLGLNEVHRAASASYLAQMQAALARGDTTEVRRWFGVLAEHRGDVRGAELSLDWLYLETLLLLDVRDTAAAVLHLDAALDALASLKTDLLEHPARAAALVRAMALRAELAAAAGDARAARRWARAVVDLWSGADPELEPVLVRMRALLARPA